MIRKHLILGFFETKLIHIRLQVYYKPKKKYKLLTKILTFCELSLWSKILFLKLCLSVCIQKTWKPLNRSGPNFVDNSNDPREGLYDGQRWTICPKKMSTFLSCANIKKDPRNTICKEKWLQLKEQRLITKIVTRKGRQTIVFT